jgi:hypothetical protein
MSSDRSLIDTIKRTFAEYSSAQLKTIASVKDFEEWSPEAVEAAREILSSRNLAPESEPVSPREPPPPPSGDPYDLGFILGVMAFNVVSPIWVIPLPGRRGDDEDIVANDMPVPFGPKMAWLAVETTDTRSLAEVLKLRARGEATWAGGIAAAQQGAVFVTPPLADWTLAVGTALFPPDRTDTFVKPLLERLSRQFGEAQYFATQSDFQLHIWARARRGRLVRGYGWLGQRALTLWDEGALTEQERELEFQFSAGVGDPTGITDGPLRTPDESCVTQLACLWSVDPTTLNADYKEPVLGLLGRWPGVDTQIRQ